MKAILQRNRREYYWQSYKYSFVIDRIAGPIATLRQLRLIRFEKQGQSRLHCRERRSHARGMYPTQDTSYMKIGRLKREGEADSTIIAKD